MDDKTAKKLMIFLFGHYPFPATKTTQAVFKHRFLHEESRDVAAAIEQFVVEQPKPPSWGDFRPYIYHHRGLRLARENTVDTSHRLNAPDNPPATPESMRAFMADVDKIVNRFSEPFRTEEPRKHTLKVPDEAITGPICCFGGCYAPATIELEIEEWKSIIKFCAAHAQNYVSKLSEALTIQQTAIVEPDLPSVGSKPDEPKAETSEKADASSGPSGPPVGEG